jgi:hypothetical protein
VSDGGALAASPARALEIAPAEVAFGLQMTDRRDASSPCCGRGIPCFISGQKRGVFGVIKRELRRRSAIEPITAAE